MPVSRTVLAGLLVSLVVPGVQAAEPLRDLDVHGTMLRPTCAAGPWREARGALERAAGGRDPEALVAYARALLCGQGAADAALLRRTAPRRIPELSEGTGQARVRVRVDAAQALAPRAGAAWHLQVGAEGDAVHLNWHANEACVHVVRLQHRPGAGWRTVEVGSACD